MRRFDNIFHSLSESSSHLLSPLISLPILGVQLSTKDRERREIMIHLQMWSPLPLVSREGGAESEGGLLRGIIVLLHCAPWNCLKWTAIQEHPFLQFIPQCSHWGSVYKIKTGSLSRTFALSATPFEVKHNLGTVSGIKKVVNQSVCLKTDVNKEIRRGCQK